MKIVQAGKEHERAGSYDNGRRRMANLTKKALSDALRELLAARPLDKITVQDITDHCGLNRNTFYYHFENTYDLLEWTISQDADRIMDKCIETGDVEEAVNSTTSVLQENRDMILNIMSSVERKRIVDFSYEYFGGQLERLIRELCKKKYENPSEAAMKEAIVFCRYSITGSILEWIDQGMKDLPENRVADLNRMFYNVIDNIGEKSEYAR